ncbi:MAG: hypothetical protein HY907_21425 [Deltaproteobacteria bacterium]|nr:hypothetical protein [Deltaproteobacteria bacterium]
MNDPCSALDALEEEYEALARRLGAATWLSYVGEEEGATVEDPAIVRAEFGPLFERAGPALAACRTPGDDPVLARRVEIWRRCESAWRLDGDPEAVRLRTDLERRVNEHAFVRGDRTWSRSDLSRLSRSDDPAERRLVVELRADLHREVVEDTLSLVSLRKDAATRQGGGTYAEAMLGAEGLPPDMLDPLLRELDERTAEAWADVLRRGREAGGDPAATLAPWDVPWLIEKLGTIPDDRWPKERALPALTETLLGIGIELESLPIRRKEGDFGYGGQTLAVSIPDDVRMMINPLPGWRVWGTLFHETGHALQGVGTAVRSPILKGYEWLAGASVPAYAEGMAELLGLLVGDRAFLERRTDLTTEEIERFLALWRARSLVALRSHLADVALERALYREGTDVDGVERETAERFLGIVRPADAPATWAATAFLAAYPCYMQNYVLADLIAAQVLQAVRERFGEGWLDDPAVGAFLREALWSDGETREWTVRVREATGTELSAEAYLAFLTGT